MSKLKAATEWLISLEEPGAHVFFDDWQFNILGEMTTHDSVDDLTREELVEVGVRIFDELTHERQQFNVVVPLARMTAVPTCPVRINDLPESEDLFLVGSPAIYIPFGYDVYGFRTNCWFCDDVMELHSGHSWLSAQEDEPSDDEPYERLFNVRLHMLTYP